jgi:hypothetical protein
MQQQMRAAGNIRANNLGGHGGLGRIDKALSAHAFHWHGKHLINVSARLLARQAEAADDGSRVYLVLHQFVGSLQSSVSIVRN